MKSTANCIHQSLNDSELLKLTKLVAGREISAALQLLDYLLEVDLRKLYATVNNCSSLFDYLVKELGFSEPMAADRVNAVRLMRAVPVVKAHLVNGDLTITSAAKIQRSLNAEQKVHPQKKAPSLHEKETRVNACLGKSKREVEKTLFEFQSEPAKAAMSEKISLVTSTRSEIKFTIDESTLSKLNELKDLIGTEPLEKIFDQALDALLVLEKKKRGVSAKSTNQINTNQINTNRTSADQASSGSAKSPTPNNANFHRPLKSAEKTNGRQDRGQTGGDKNNSDSNRKSDYNSDYKNNQPRSHAQLNSRFIPIDLRRLVFERSKGQCEHVDPFSGKRCSSHFRLQIDHILPIALNGKTEASNLRHLCFAHNQRMAVQMGLRMPNESVKYH